MQIQDRDISTIIPYARNPRINEKAIATVAGSLKEFGFRQPIVVDDDGVIIVGHTRLEAARQLGLRKVPVHVASDLSENKKKAYRIADNRSAQDAEWDEELLTLELSDLKDMQYDLSHTGFDSMEIGDLFHGSDFQPGTEQAQSSLDNLDPKMATCPHCGKDFDLREQS